MKKLYNSCVIETDKAAAAAAADHGYSVLDHFDSCFNFMCTGNLYNAF